MNAESVAGQNHICALHGGAWRWQSEKMGLIMNEKSNMRERMGHVHGIANAMHIHLKERSRI